VLAIDIPHFHLQGVLIPYINSFIFSTTLEERRLIILRLIIWGKKQYSLQPTNSRTREFISLFIKIKRTRFSAVVK